MGFANRTNFILTLFSTNLSDLIRSVDDFRQAMFLETLKVVDGRIHYLAWHQARLNHTRRLCLQQTQALNLSPFLNDMPQQGVYRCRVRYAHTVEQVSYHAYTPKPMHSLQFVECADLDYRFKYAERHYFQQLLDRYPDVSDVIVTQSGQITDSTIANLAFWRAGQWFTPQHYLLAGTTRQRYVAAGYVTVLPITQAMLPYFSHIALLNAMLGFKVLGRFQVVGTRLIIQ